MQTAADEFLVYLIMENNSSRLPSIVRSNHKPVHTPILSLDSVQNQFQEINSLTATHTNSCIYKFGLKATS